MRKAYLSICAVLIFNVSFAQMKTIESPNQIINSKNVAGVTPSTNPNTAATAPFWSNDFSNPNDWTMVDLIYGGLQNWVITSQGPQGAYSNAMGPITSTSGGNFALYDSDYLNNAYNPQEATLTYNGSVDCSNYQYVNINFESYHRKFHDSVFVEVSTDPNFTTFGRYEVHPGQAVNVTSANPEYVSINISADASYQSAVYFRFHYEGEWDYAWMIDDVSFSETPENSITFSDETFGGWWIGYQATGDLGSDFTFYPMSQATAQPYRLEGVITNVGIQTQNNTMLNVEVEDPFGVTSLLTSTPFTSASGQRDTIATASNFNPTTMGIHNFSFWASSQDTITDTIVRSTIVTDTIYGVDFDWDSDGANAGWGYDLGVACGGQVLGNVFDIYAADEVTSISFHVNEDSRPGATLKVELYEMDGTNDPILISESDDYTLTNADIDSWKTLSFNDAVPVYAGFSYLAAVHGEAHPIDTSFISVNSNGNSSTWGQDNGCDWNSANPPGSWYTLGSTMLIRMNFGTISAGILDNLENNIEIFPNPSNGIFTINLNNPTQSSVVITDVLGKVVYSEYNIITNKHIVDLSSMQKGIYLITIEDNSTYTEKITIK